MEVAQRAAVLAPRCGYNARSLRPLVFHAFPALCSVLALLSCGSEVDIRKTGTRAVVIGIDGADWKIIEALATEGGMPNLMGLRERGTWGPIETLNDIPLSPVIWTSVATGKTPAKHGVTWFMVDQPDGTRVPVRSFNRKTKAIWNILSDSGRRPIVLGWWATFPAESVGKGAIISDALGYHGFGATARGGDDSKKTYPAELYDAAFARVPAEQQIPAEFVQRFIHLSEAEYRQEMFDPARFPRPNPFNPIHLFQQYAVTAQGYTAIAEDLLESRDYDLFLLYFEQIDSFSHLFMKYAPPKLEWVDEQGFDRYRDLVTEWYKYQDELLGRILAGIDLQTTAVFLLSDHGFKSGERRIRSEQTVDVKRAHLDHETDGIFLAAGPHIRPGGKIAGASVLDLTPTLLHYLGFPVAKDMDGKVLDRVFLPEFMDQHPIRYIGTYEDELDQETREQTEEYDAEEQAANERALRALGYLGGSEGGEPEPEVAKDDAGESSPEMHNNMGRIHLRNGEPDKARREFQKALELDPSNAEALLNLAGVHRLEGRVADAEHLVRRALQVDPNSIGALSQLAELRRDQNDLDDAVRLFEEALAIDNSQPFLYMGYGDVLQRAGRFADAEAAFKSVLELEPDSFKARYNLGVTYANQNRVDESIALYRQALELEPKHPEATLAHNNLGAIFLDRGHPDEAMESFEQAVALGPGHVESRYNLALIYSESGRMEEAVELLEQAARLAPDHEVINTGLGMAYLHVGRSEDSYKSFLLVRRLYPKSWRALLGLAVLHAASGQPDQADKYLEESLANGGRAARAEAAGFPVLQEFLR